MSTETRAPEIQLDGLTETQVKESRIQHGENLLTPPPHTSLWRLYIEKFRDPIIRILLVAAFVSLIFAFIEGQYAETIGIFLAIILATSIGFYFERDAARKFNVLTELGEEEPVKVRRNGVICEIPRHEVVVGDVVIVEVGDEIPADGELLLSTDLQIDESSLTGEPIITKHADPQHVAHEAAYPEDTVLRSTMVMNGSGTFRVTAVGNATEIGKVARHSTEATGTQTPLNRQLDRLAKLISKIGVSVAVVVFVGFLAHDVLTNPLWQGDNYLRMAETVLRYFMMSVTLIVMAVPEGLPMAVTLSLALNMRRMLKSNNLVRKLHACETMGAVTVICTDKTGTLTQNRMQVHEMLRYEDNDELLSRAIAMNTTAHIDGNDATHGIGNPTEVALLLWMQCEGHDTERLRAESNILDRLPFSTQNKFMATVADVGGKPYLFVKGAPEIVTTYCRLTDAEQTDVTTQLRSFQNKAMRTLVFAYKPLDSAPVSTDNILSIMQGLTLQAVAAIEDPVREDVPGAVKQCTDAGIEIKMVTGDTSATAIEIARRIGIWDETTPDEAQITGSDFAALSDKEAFDRVKVIRVMSRARPTDKQRLVEMLQKHGEVVAVTGDGTNDAPALHHAHVGLSLGTGTSVAKDASDMTLLDDSFRSIENAVLWGRSLYKNIQRFLVFQLIVNVSALLLVLAGSFIGTEIPLTVTQILWVNLIMDTFAAMALASLPPSREVMIEKPRNKDEFIITRPMLNSIIGIGLCFAAVLFTMLACCQSAVASTKVHQLTLFFTTFVMLQFWNLLNAKTLGSTHSAFHHFWWNRGLLLVLFFILAGQWIIVTFGGEMFRTVPLSPSEWVIIIASTSAVLWIGELYRWIKRLRHA